MLDLGTIDHLLTTTRSVRKRLDFDRPVEPEVIERCLEIATQAPSGADRQKWHFVVVTDPALKQPIADYYRASFDLQYGAARNTPGNPVIDSAIYLADRMHLAPVLVLFCYEGRVEQAGPMAQAALYGSILPAAWSFMLALRARGLGSAWTTLHLRHEREIAHILGLPERLTQAVLLPVAYYSGESFKPARRAPVADVTHWDGWGKHRDG